MYCAGQLTGDVQTSLPGRAVYRPFKETTINSLKHRILVFLYRRAASLSNIDENPFEIRNFYKYFEQVLWIYYIFKRCYNIYYLSIGSMTIFYSLYHVIFSLDNLHFARISDSFIDILFALQLKMSFTHNSSCF